MTERILQANVMHALKRRGGHWTNLSPSPYSAAGIPDIIGCYKGRYVAIELKAPERYSDPRAGLSEAQRRFLDAVGHEGGYAIVADDLRTIVAVLEAIDATDVAA